MATELSYVRMKLSNEAKLAVNFNFSIELYMKYSNSISFNNMKFKNQFHWIIYFDVNNF